MNEGNATWPRTQDPETGDVWHGGYGYVTESDMRTVVLKPRANVARNVLLALLVFGVPAGIAFTLVLSRTQSGGSLTPRGLLLLATPFALCLLGILVMPLRLSMRDIERGPILTFDRVSKVLTANRTRGSYDIDSIAEIHVVRGGVTIRRIIAGHEGSSEKYADQIFVELKKRHGISRHELVFTGWFSKSSRRAIRAFARDIGIGEIQFHFLPKNWFERITMLKEDYRD